MELLERPGSALEVQELLKEVEVHEADMELLEGLGSVLEVQELLKEVEVQVEGEPGLASVLTPEAVNWGWGVWRSTLQTPVGLVEGGGRAGLASEIQHGPGKWTGPE